MRTTTIRQCYRREASMPWLVTRKENADVLMDEEMWKYENWTAFRSPRDSKRQRSHAYISQVVNMRWVEGNEVCGIHVQGDVALIPGAS